jgi:hypothetical protein
VTVEFDDDVLIPKRRGKPPASERAPVIPFDDFPLGKSKFFPSMHPSTASSAIGAYQDRFPDRKFSYRFFASDPKCKEPGVRIWRLR